MGLARMYFYPKVGNGVPAEEMVGAIKSLPEGTVIIDTLESEIYNSTTNRITLVLWHPEFIGNCTVFLTAMYNKKTDTGTEKRFLGLMEYTCNEKIA